MKRKIEFIGDGWGYYIIEDYQEYQNELREQGISDLNIERYFATGTYLPEMIEKSNGIHFLYGELESIYQSDDVPPKLLEEGFQKVIVS